jgi:hypothetical protein
MKFTTEQKAARKAAFRAMSPADKLDYIVGYYKWPILLAVILLLILGSAARRQLTKKEPVIYLALTDVVAGEDLENALTAGFLRAEGANPGRQEVYLYRDLYLSEDADTLNHEYAYASEMKLMGAVQSQRLDLVLMNREAYDLLSQKGYLADLSAPADGEAWPEELAAYLTENEVVLSDNTIDVLLDESIEEERVTRWVPNAFLLSQIPLFQNAGFDGEVYLGLVANSPRTDAALGYIRYLAAAAGAS